MSETIPDFPVKYRLRRAMEFADVEADAVAERLGVSVNTVWNYLAGRTRPRRMALSVVAEMTDVPLWWLEGREPTEADTERFTEGYARAFQMQLFAAA